MDDLISVLLPLYNAEAYLEQCLESILNQTYTQFEVIAVNDGSSDSSSAILSRFSQTDARIKPLHLPKNKGIVAALNAGLSICRGKWVARMDADDLMHPQRLEQQLIGLHSNPGIDILGSRIKLFRYDGELTPGQLRYRDWSNGLLTDAEIKSNMFAESPIMHPTFFLRLETFKYLGGYLENPWAEDYDILLRAYVKGMRFGKLPDILVDKGDHPQRLARTDDRCKRPAMFAAKAHYFVQVPRLRQNKSKIMIMGTGSAGRMTYQALKSEGFEIDGFVDNKGSGGDRRVCGKTVFHMDLNQAGEFLESHKQTFFLLCIGAEEGRQFVEKVFAESGIVEGMDYLRFI
ncbi:MAG: glycosyltransferase [Proteobacteria bacterium]|nr:glycosyltransferase [Pseudomonadota bacterium]